MTVTEKNFWLTTVEAPVISAQPLPETVDVAVVGAGFTGLSAARSGRAGRAPPCWKPRTSDGEPAVGMAGWC